MNLTSRERRDLRPVLAHQAMLLRAWGVGGTEIARALGMTRSQATELANDPDLRKRRLRMKRLGGTCEVCGDPTSVKRSGGAHTRCWRHQVFRNGVMRSDMLPPEPLYAGPTIARTVLDVDLQARAEAAVELCRTAKTQEERLDLLAAVVWPTGAILRVAA